MSKEIVINMWCSVVPDAMYNKWIKKGWIHKGDHDLQSFTKEDKMYYEILEKKEDRKVVHCEKTVESMKKNGWRSVRKVTNVPPKILAKINEEVNIWYIKVFDYVTKWLKKNKYIQLKKGSFNGGFCAVQKEDDTTKKWGAPLALKRNKVAQIKEKFGYITVYFDSLTKEERVQIEEFAKKVEKKFDCLTRFN